MLFTAIEAARLLQFDAVSLMLVQITDLGGRVIFGSMIIVIGVIMARIVTRLVGDSVGESGLPAILKYAIIDRKSVVRGKSVSVRVDLVGSRIHKKKKLIMKHQQSV